MGKILVEVCIISARGLRRSSSLLKHQWYAVGWIDPSNKYCTNIDVSRNDNPFWKTKFATLLGESNLKDSTSLHVEVYSREPIFLREKLHGSATVVLKEFLAKYKQSSSSSGPEELGSYQLRKRNSSKPQGFVDVSIRVSAEREDSNSYPGANEGFVLTNTNGETKLSTEGGNSGQIYLSGSTQSSIDSPYNRQPVTYAPYHSNPPNYPNPELAGPSHRPAGTPPPPPPPSNTGYIPTFLPRSETYVNLPSSGGAANLSHGRGGPGPGFAAGVGAGALAAGAVIFGDDFMSGFDMTPGLPDHASLTISTDPPF